VDVEHLLEEELTEEAKVLGKNLHQCHFVYPYPKRPNLRLNPGCRDGNPASSQQVTRTISEKCIREKKVDGSGRGRI
jgi:hypothetical protein